MKTKTTTDLLAAAWREESRRLDGVARGHISGADGVQAHTETLWRLLRRYRVPVLLFVTKMDLTGADRAAVVHVVHQMLEAR